MKPGRASLARRGERALRRHLADGGEHGLLEAHELGRAALAADLGILDVVQLLWRGVAALPACGTAAPESARAIEGFLLDCLSPYEMSLRGSREANEALRRIDERREEHMRRVARELHDEAGQLLACVRLSLEALRPHVAAAGEEQLSKTVSLLDDVSEELRRVAHELRPTVLDDLGLLPALRFLAEGVTRRSGVTVTVAGSTGGRLPEPVETAVFRTAQEALTNVVRHARASHALIEVRRAPHEVRWMIRDDGCGFDVDAPRDPGRVGGMGLDGIRERVAPLGGAVRIRSRAGRGTALLVRVPLEASHGDARPARG